MTQKGEKKNPLRPGKKSGPASSAPVERRKKSTGKKDVAVALPKEEKGAGGKKGGGLH
ncbi:MAG TPA: hypothetical protein VM934_01915 [Pyrinomonadaceae bacterium]|jgi:hypothetical protein|nr:hypothetical protein [Pyrinomonadaceae bacterium]